MADLLKSMIETMVMLGPISRPRIIANAPLIWPMQVVNWPTRRITFIGSGVLDSLKTHFAAPMLQTDIAVTSVHGVRVERFGDSPDHDAIWREAVVTLGDQFAVSPEDTTHD